MENEVLETEQVNEVVEEVVEEQEAEQAEQLEQESEAEQVAEQEAETVEAEKEPEPQKTPAWITELRRQNREMKRQLQAVQSTQGAPLPQLGAKPTLEGCDFDSERFENEYAAWTDKKLRIEAHRREQAQHEERLQQTWQEKVSGYEAKKTNARTIAPDFDDAEEVCKDVLSNVQQVIIVKNARDPAKLVLEIGRNPELAAKLGSITDPVEFTYQIATMEAKMATKSPAKSTPSPDKPLRASGGVSGGLSGNKLGQLRAEAEKTGNYDKVYAYRKQMKAETS